MSAIEKSTIASRVSRELRRRIVTGQYAIGSKLQQEQIANDLGVSRSPVREALYQLEAEGLVTLVSQKGATVSDIRRDEVKELFELRVLIEPYLLSLSIPNMIDADFDAAKALIVEMDSIELSLWGEANWRFHSSLYRAAKRPTIMRQLSKIHETVERYLRMQLTLTDGRPKAHGEHQRILDACRDRQIEVAVALLRQHILTTGAAL